MIFSPSKASKPLTPDERKLLIARCEAHAWQLYCLQLASLHRMKRKLNKPTKTD